MLREALARFFRPYATCNPCRTGKDTPTIEWLRRDPTHLHKNTAPASQGRFRERWVTGEMQSTQPQ
jgi:hypothetical protein